MLRFALWDGAQSFLIARFGEWETYAGSFAEIIFTAIC